MKQHHDIDALLDRTAEQIRSAEPDARRLDEAAARVWTRLTNADAATTGAAAIEEIHGCDDYQALIPAYLAGGLPEARKLLVADHTRECVPCRRALNEAREGGAPRLAARPGRRAKVFAFPAGVTRWAMAAMLVASLGAALWFVSGMMLYGGPAAEVVTVDGTLFRMTESAQMPLRSGETIREGEVLRTGRGGSSVVRLEDGSLVEIRERSELSFDESRRGTTIELERGNVIVEAAPQRERHLYVSTAECLVSVTGTIFTVVHGTMGSRVGVVEGEVRVAFGGEETIVLPGEQVATRANLGPAPLGKQLAWSRDADHYLEVLREFTELRQELRARVPPVGLRFESRLLDLVPEGTVLYAALPNLTEKVTETHRVIRERIESSPVMREWWQERQGAHYLEPHLDDLVSRLEEFGHFLGDELVVSAQTGAGEDEEFIGPLALAEIADADGIRSFIENLGEELGEHGEFDPSEVAFLDDPFAEAPDAEIFIWLTDDLLVASPEIGQVRRVAEFALQGAANPFVGTAFYDSISALYDEGASILVAGDLEGLVATAIERMDDEEQLRTFERLGVLNARHVLVEQKGDETTQHRATLTFRDARQGVAAWLAEPAPMASLDFVTPEAKFAATLLTEDPAKLFDDLVGMGHGDGAEDGLEEFEERFGFSLRDDFAAVLGGEFTVAIDGPILPTLSWKVIVEVYDPARFQFILEQMVAEANRHLAEEGEGQVEITSEEVGGRTFYEVQVPYRDAGTSFAYTFEDGYLVAAPNRALLDRALRSREAGFTLTESARFRDLLPTGGRTNFSALVFQDLTSLFSEVAGHLSTGDLTAQQQEMLDQLREANRPTLGYAYGESDRITFAAASDTDLMSTLVQGMLGLENPASTMGVLGQVMDLGI